MKKSLIKLLSSTLALTLVLASSGAGTAQIDKIKSEEAKADNTVAVVQEVKEEKEESVILSAVEEKLKEEIPVVEVKAETAAEVAAPEAEVKAEEVAAPEIKVVPAEGVAAPEAEPTATWDVSASESDNVTMSFYAAPEVTGQVDMDLELGELYIDGEGAMEESVYRYLMSKDKFVSALTTLFEEEYNLKGKVEAVYDPDITDVLELDKNIRFYSIETGEELFVTEDMRLNLDPAAFIEFSPIEIYISEGITNVSDYAFIFCSNITSICLPSTIETIGSCAFQYCAKLNKVTIPENAEISEDAFSYCHSLETVEFANDILYNGGFKPAGYPHDGPISSTLTPAEIEVLVYGK